MKTLKRSVFSKKHFRSGDGMLTTVWGPSLWHYLHLMSFNYPINPTKQNIKYFKQFILNLSFTLPCKHCRDNLENNLKMYPLIACHLKNRTSFSKYIFHLHERINKQLGKVSGLSYSDVRERYEHFRSRCSPKVGKLFKFTKKRKHDGCTEPLYGEKSKCLIKIVPQSSRTKTLSIDKLCLKRSKTVKKRHRQ